MSEEVKTPRTDARQYHRMNGVAVTPYVDAEFARELECELTLERQARERAEDRASSAWICMERSVESDSVVASCNCDTKTNDIQFHKPGCKYRLITERDTAIAQCAALRVALEKIHDMAAYPRECAADLIGKDSAESELRERIASEACRGLSTPPPPPPVIPKSQHDALLEVAKGMA